MYEVSHFVLPQHRCPSVPCKMTARFTSLFSCGCNANFVGYLSLYVSVFF